ncbi:protein-tyrosine phosphatase family protein [Zavarzinella formosa]|uniref:protein-tyrosine phosphatase family protein n=1 Tax=Zavarzinella formosa TaxID=360055 RepID=UPI0007C5CF1D|nr:dual specificity protein phosphatase family protein [Zavarzinella formosa]
MRINLYWVDGASSGRVAIMPRPRGGDWLEDEIPAWRQAGVDIVVSLLTPDEVADLDLAQEEEQCGLNGIRFISLPINDRCIPESREAFAELIMFLAEMSADGKNIGIHCRQGIGRAAVVAICLLIWKGADPNAAIGQVSLARGCDVPETPEQRQWVLDFARSSPKPLPG